MVLSDMDTKYMILVTMVYSNKLQDVCVGYKTR